MRGKAGIRPSPAVSAFKALAGMGMTILGVCMYAETQHPFLILWCLVAVGFTLYHGINAVSEKAPPVEVVDFDARGEPAPGPSAADRLRELDDLKKEHLVSQEEYDRKRREILDRL